MQDTPWCPHASLHISIGRVAEEEATSPDIMVAPLNAAPGACAYETLRRCSSIVVLSRMPAVKPALVFPRLAPAVLVIPYGPQGHLATTLPVVSGKAAGGGFVISRHGSHTDRCTFLPQVARVVEAVVGTGPCTQSTQCNSANSGGTCTGMMPTQMCSCNPHFTNQYCQDCAAGWTGPGCKSVASYSVLFGLFKLTVHPEAAACPCPCLT